MSIVEEAGRLDRLLARCKKGDQDSWVELVDVFQRMVYSIPRRMRLPEEDCADVFQATFTALYRNLDRIEQPGALPKWLSVTASRESLRLKRINSSTADRETRDLDEIVADEEISAEQSAVESVQSEILWTNVNRLKERCRELITSLYSSEEPAYEDISIRLGIPMGAIGPTRARCLDKLRQLLENQSFFK